jgi:hypothetical protein
MCDCDNVYIKPVKLAYWYFRLNGFLTIPNFIVHPDIGIGQYTEVDILGVRFPYRAELLENTMKDDELFTKMTKPFFIIAEVKKDRCRLNEPWKKPSKKNMQRILVALGAFCHCKIDDIAHQLYEDGFYEDEPYIISLVFVGKRRNPEYFNRYPKVPQITWEEIAKFIYNRFFRYRDQKLFHNQWDQTGKKIWHFFEQCCEREDGQQLFIKKIIKRLSSD